MIMANKFTYISVLLENKMPQIMITEVDPNVIPDGVPVFDSKEEASKSCQKNNKFNYRTFFVKDNE